MEVPPPPSAYDDGLLEEMRRRIIEIRSRASTDYEDLAESTLQPIVPDSLESPSEAGSDEYAEEINLELLQSESNLILEMEEALARIDGRGEYTYGLCYHCREEPKGLCQTCPWIPADRLRYMPWARNCAPVQEELERSKPGS